MFRSISAPRSIRKPIAAVAIVAGMALGFAGPAHADSGPPAVIVADACSGGTVNRSVTVSITTTTDFTSGFKVHAVTGSPKGPITQTREVAINNPPQKTGTVTFDLPAGSYYFDWEDRSGDGVTYSGRHSGISDFYLGLVEGTLTNVAACELATTTTAAATTTTIPPTTATAAATTTTVVATTVTAAAVTTTTAAVNPPTTGTAAPTTAVVQTTAAASAVTLPATGSNSTPLVAAGIAFLGLGSMAVLSTRRRRPA